MGQVKIYIYIEISGKSGKAILSDFIQILYNFLVDDSLFGSTLYLFCDKFSGVYLPLNIGISAALPMTATSYRLWLVFVICSLPLNG